MRPVINLRGYDSGTAADGIGAYDPVQSSLNFLGGPAPKRTAIFRPKAGAAPGFPGFAAWVAATHPELYNYLRVSLPDYIGDIEGPRSGALSLGAIDPGLITVDPITLPAFRFDTSGPAALADNTGPTTSIWAQITDTVKNAAAVILPTIQQQKLLNVQLDRAKAGLPPLDLSRYESASQGLNVGINRSTQTTLLMIAAGVAGVFLLSKVLGKR